MTEEKDETIREDIGYRNIETKPLWPQQQNESEGGMYSRQLGKKLKRIQIRMDGQVYSYDPELAALLVKQRKAKYV